MKLLGSIASCEQVRQDPPLLVANILIGRPSMNRQKKVISKRSAMNTQDDVTWDGLRSGEPSGQVYRFQMGDCGKKKGTTLVMDKLWESPVWSPFHMSFHPLLGSQATVLWEMEWCY